jgi:tripartite-type tricarboxylate transporter receptor subunit TctC
MAGKQAFPPRGSPGKIPPRFEAAILLALWLAFSPQALAASTLARGYPTLPVSLAVPFAENDQGNAFLELFLPALRGATPQPVTLRRVPGRGGGYALREILGKPADGHSLALLTLPSFFLQAVPQNRLYTREEITPMVFLAHVPTALWVAEDSPLATLDDLIALARSREVSATPGVPDSQARSPDLPLATAGAGSYSDGQMASLLLARAAGIRIQYLPFLSTAKASEAVRQGVAAACFGYACATPPLPGLRPLAVAAETRVPALPRTPTFREAGLEVIAGQDIGLAMPAGADSEDVALIADFFLRLQASANLGAALSREGFFPLSFPHAETAAFLRRREEAVNAFLEEYPLFPIR